MFSIRSALALGSLLLVAPVAACGSTSSTPSKSDGGAGTSGSQSPSGSASSSQAALPFNSDHLLKGNAKPNFPDGAANTVAVVQQGPVINLGNGAGAYIPIAFRNNTSKAISHVDWTGVAKVGGKIVSTGESQGTDPAQIAPGAVGLSYVLLLHEGAAAQRSVHLLRGVKCSRQVLFQHRFAEGHPG